jgi:hypothetical protein
MIGLSICMILHVSRRLRETSVLRKEDNSTHLSERV